MPCDVVARVAPIAYHASAEFEVELAQRLAETESPVAALDPRVEPRVHVRDGFVMNLWTYYEPVPPERSRQATTRTRSSACMPACGRSISRHRTSPIESRRPNNSSGAANTLRRSLTRTGSSQQHPTKPETSDRRPRRRRAAAARRAAPRKRARHDEGPLFIDLETCCRGPVEFDIAHVPEDVSEHYPDADHELLGECRALTLAMVAAWRWDRDDHHPDGRRAGRELLSALREGPPWPTLDLMNRRSGSP